MTESLTSITSGNASALAACLMVSVIVVFFSPTCKQQTTTWQLSFKSITIHHPSVTLFSLPHSVIYKLKHSIITKITYYDGTVQPVLWMY